jgi:hypothetical protein
MPDSPSENPYDAGLMQLVVAGFTAFGSGRRQQQSNATTRWSTSLVTSVAFPNFSDHRLSGRPDPDGPTIDTLRAHRVPLPDEDSNIHPNVETRRGQYDGSYLIIPSISQSIQRQVRRIKQGLTAAIQPDPDVITPPPRQILIPPSESNQSAPITSQHESHDSNDSSEYLDATPDDFRWSNSETDTFFDMDLPPDSDNIFRSSISQVTSGFGRLSFDSRPSLQIPPVTPSFPIAEDLYPLPLVSSLDPDEGIDPHSKERQRMVKQVFSESQYKIPTDHSAFPRWHLLIKTAMAGSAWEVNGAHIILESHTTPSNSEVLALFAQLLFNCSHNSTKQIQDDFFLRGMGHALMECLQGCDLFGLLEKTYQPSGSNWAWKWDEQLTSLQHEQSESVPSFWGHLQDPGPD